MERSASRSCWFTPGESTVDGHLGGLQSLYGCYSEERYHLALPRIDLRFVSHPSRRLVAIPTELLVFGYAGMTNAYPPMMWTVFRYCVHFGLLIFSVICCIYDLIPYVMRIAPSKLARATALFSVRFQSRTDAVSSGVFSVVLLNPARRTLG
jgi:hypothetical protein